MADAMKKCTKCKVTKPIEEFSKHIQTKDKRQSWCRKCSTKSGKKWEQKNHEKVKSYKRDWYAIQHFGKTRKEVLNILGNVCSKCGSEGNLHIHHEDGNGRRSKKINNDLNNLVVLCVSCHNYAHMELNKEVTYA